MDLAELPSPVGLVEVGVNDAALVSLRFVEPRHVPPEHQANDRADRQAKDLSGILERLRAYFSGDLAAVGAIPVRFERGTAFQQAVWSALRRIPVGETISYAELARRVGRPSAFRAVGSANGQNPIGIVVPCHRVIAADGKLGGYAGGVERKRWLLAHERAMRTPEDATLGPSI